MMHGKSGPIALCGVLAALALMAVMSAALHRKTAAKRAANGC